MFGRFTGGVGSRAGSDDGPGWVMASGYGVNLIVMTSPSAIT